MRIRVRVLHAARAGATRSALVQRPFFLPESARRAAGAGAACSVVLFCSEFLLLLVRRAHVVCAARMYVDQG
ncbi:hypothetical protein A2U01_0085597 [Trifolium medium]|uniref:Uncharacterized protein n=1 Tax=Trifolium medium TaxID=97028 RepID=A0A392TTV0_9FABA|nr:hypothetical protein [Trifolium medium]